MQGLESLMGWAIDKLQETPEQRGDAIRKINEARSTWIRVLKTKNNQIKACRKIRIDCTELEEDVKNIIKSLELLDELEQKFRIALN